MFERVPEDKRRHCALATWTQPRSSTDKTLAALLHSLFIPQSFYLILNLALGTEGTQFTTNHNGGVPVTEEQLRLALQSAAGQAARMEVDWVRVFGQRDP